jgi:parallel beta-helix repeat protein
MKENTMNSASKFLAVLGLLAVGVVLVSVSDAQAANCTRVAKNTIISNPSANLLTVQLCSGTYRFDDSDTNGIIIIRGSNIVLDGSGVQLSGRNSRGYGVYMNGSGTAGGYTNVTIKNFALLSGFNYGMRIENASNVTIQKNVISANKISDGTFLNINVPVTSAVGGGLLLNNVTNSTVGESATVTKPSGGPASWTVNVTSSGLYNTMQSQNTGIDMYNSSNNVVAGNLVSNNKAWGIRMYASTGNVIYNNLANNINRCNNSGCDSAALLLVEGSNANRIEKNNLKSSGDGFFIGNENSNKPSNNNYIVGNDGSNSPNNAFEATFATGNVFEGNIAANSHYGFWLGYSVSAQLINNTITNNSGDGINIDRGTTAILDHNTITNNGQSGLAFTKGSCSPTTPAVPVCPDSTGHKITANTLQDNKGWGIYIADTSNLTVNNANTISGSVKGFDFSGLSTGATVNNNNITCASAAATCSYNIYNNMDPANSVDATGNWWGTTDQATIGSKIKGTVNYTPWLETVATPV